MGDVNLSRFNFWETSRKARIRTCARFLLVYLLQEMLTNQRLKRYKALWYKAWRISKKYNEFILHVAKTWSIQHWQRTITSNDRWRANLREHRAYGSRHSFPLTLTRRAKDEVATIVRKALVKERVRWCVGVVIRWRQTAVLQTRKVSKEQRAPETAYASYIMGTVFKTYACTLYVVCRWECLSEILGWKFYMR